MNNIKYTGTNIASAVLILAFFFPWVGMVGMSMSGFNIMSNGISPGVLSYMISGLSRLLMILVLVVPLCGALILYQNITSNLKFSKYYKLAHLLPAVYLILGVVYLYFKMKPDTSGLDENVYGAGFSRQVRDMTPGVFDILSFGAYICIAAAVYLLLVNFGKIKDKEYYKPAVTTDRPKIDNESRSQID